MTLYDRQRGKQGLFWLWPAFPCIFVWGLYLAAFWPGIMTSDSLDQWGQMLQGTFGDNHPAFHTMTIWLITRIWRSPAMVALAQIVIMAGVFSFALRELAFWSVSQKVRLIVTGIFSLSIVNSLMVITLWKDVAYTIAMLSLFTLLLKLVRTRGTWLHRWIHVGSLWFVLVLIALYRHNGLPVAFLILLGLLVSFRSVARKRLILVSVVWFVSILLIKGPIYQLIGIVPITRSFAIQTQIHQIGAFVHADVQLSAQEMATITSIQPLESWKKNYLCYSLEPLYYNDHVHYRFLEEHTNDVLRVWIELVLHHPRVFFAHQKCANSMIWRVFEPKEGYIATFYLSNISENNLDIVPASLLPKLNAAIKLFAQYSVNSSVIWFVWRPAFYLYIHVACVLILALRWQMRLMLVLMLPACMNSLVLLFIITVQDFRFQYPVFVIGLITPALLFAKKDVLVATVSS